MCLIASKLKMDLIFYRRANKGNDLFVFFLLETYKRHTHKNRTNFFISKVKRRKEFMRMMQNKPFSNKKEL